MITHLLKKGMLASVLSLALLPVQAQRDTRTINDNWEFRKEADAQWTSVNLPHTYNLDAYAGMQYYQGKGIYRRTLNLPEVKEGKRYYLKVDAASKAAEVRVNGTLVAEHAGGYTAFTADITSCVKPENLIEITVDNGRKDITPISADFTFWGGIYRDVWFIETSEQHFNMENKGSDGIFISTPVVNDREGVLKIRTEIANDGDKLTTLEIKNEIYSPDGTLLQTLRRTLRLDAGEISPIETVSDPIWNPELWTPETPALYRIETSLADARTGETLDRKTHRIGFRWYSFDGEKGFFLNGKPYKLRGFNRHQDQAPVGVALPDEAHRRDVAQMKELGANFIRISHYPQDDAILDLCDELGLLAWEEIPIINIVPDTPGYADNCERNLREMIHQHYNHTCVIAWGYMNEILLVTPGPDKPEWPAYKERTVALAQRLEKVLKEEDPARASVMAYNMTNLYNEIGLDLIDVVGWNLYHGWYVGKLEEFNAWCEDQHRRYPAKPMIISEWGAGSDKRLHSLNGRPFDFSIEYQQTYIEHYLPFIERTPWISGCTYWNYIDFNVAGRQESMPRTNNKGVAYNDRSLKDVAYYFKSMWRDDIPVLHIASRDWDVRTGNPGKAQPVKVYTNLDEVELIVNGRSLGKQAVSNCHAMFQAALPEGVSTLVAQGTKDGQTVRDAMTIRLCPLPDWTKGDELAVNVGSNCFFTSDLSGLTWLPDQPYTQGSWGYTGGTGRSTTSEIHNTVDGPIYQTWREGDFTYRIDAPAGDYEVELLMADVTRPAAQLANLLDRSQAEQASGDTYFDIILCGKEVETNFTPAENGHFRTAFKRRYIVRNEAGNITIELRAQKGKPFLSGIKIRRL